MRTWGSHPGYTFAAGPPILPDFSHIRTVRLSLSPPQCYSSR